MIMSKTEEKHGNNSKINTHPVKQLQTHTHTANPCGALAGECSGK